MKNLSKMTHAVVLSLIFFACNESNHKIENETLNSSIQETFASKTIEIFEELTTTYFPKEDVKYLVYKDSNGFLTAKYELTGKTKEQVQMGSFVKRESRTNDGTTCDGRWSCGKAIYKCLENGQDALISVGACELSAQYCVTCQDSQE